MKSITYIVPVHNKFSYDNHINFVKNNQFLKDIDYKYVCSVNPKKTDINKQNCPNVLNIYDENNIYTKFNKYLRFKSTLMYYLQHINDINTDYVCIEGCTTYREERRLLENVNENTLYTTIRKSEDFFRGRTDYDFDKMNCYYMKYFNYNSNINTKFFLFDYCIFSKKISGFLYDFIKEYVDILINNIPPPKVFVPEFFDCCLYYHYINSDLKNKFKVEHLGFKFHTFGRKPGMHFYGG